MCLEFVGHEIYLGLDLSCVLLCHVFFFSHVNVLVHYLLALYLVFDFCFFLVLSSDLSEVLFFGVCESFPLPCLLKHLIGFQNHNRTF